MNEITAMVNMVCQLRVLCIEVLSICSVACIPWHPLFSIQNRKLIILKKIDRPSSAIIETAHQRNWLKQENNSTDYKIC